MIQAVPCSSQSLHVPCPPQSQSLDAVSIVQNAPIVSCLMSSTDMDMDQ
jgi:hypothetical protein